MGVREGPDEDLPGLVAVAQAVVLAALEHPREPRLKKIQQLQADVLHHVPIDAAVVTRGILEHLGVRGFQPGGDGLA